MHNKEEYWKKKMARVKSVVVFKPIKFFTVADKAEKPSGEKLKYRKVRKNKNRISRLARRVNRN